MLVKISDIDVDKLLKLCKENGISIETLYRSPYDAYVSDSFNRCESYFKDLLGADTLKSIRKEVEEELEDTDMAFILSMYENRLNRACYLMDEKPIAIYAISNNIGVELKQIDYYSNVALVKYGNDLYNCDILCDSNGDSIIKIDELELSLGDFIRV